jgi:TPR repeat protein
MTLLRCVRFFCAGPLFALCVIFPVLLPHCAALAASEAQKNAGQPPEEQRIAPDALFALMLVNAENGQSRAMLELGLLYENGIGVARNYSKALEWYQKAAYAGEGEAYMLVGQCHEIGIGTVADQEKAVAAFEKSVALGHAPALIKLAGVYLHGRGVDRDENKGLSLLNKAAEAGDSVAMFDLGLIVLNGLYGKKIEEQKARNWFLKAAEAGHIGGMLNVAGMFREGKGGKVDAEAALRWCLTVRKAAQQDGSQNEGLENAIAELKQTLSARQAEAAEKAADAWAAARTEALKQQNPPAR